MLEPRFACGAVVLFRLHCIRWLWMLARLLGPRLARALGWSVCVCLSSLERLHLTMTSPGRQSPRIYRSDLFPHYVVMLVFAGCTFVFKRRCLDLRCDKFRRLPRAYPSPLVRSRCNMGARPSHCGIFELCDCGVVCCGASVCFLFDSTFLGKATDAATSPEAGAGPTKSVPELPRIPF